MWLKIFLISTTFTLLLSLVFTKSIKAEETSNQAEIIFINEIFPNPDGTDAGKEWIELFNNSNLDRNVSGWRIESHSGSSSRSITLPDDTTIPANSFWLLSEFIPNETTNYTFFDSINMYNNGIRINLYNSSGDLVDSIEYTTTNSGHSWERKGPLCFEMLQTDNFTLSIKNSAYDPICWGEDQKVVSIEKIEFSDDGEAWNEQAIFKGPTNLYLRYTLSEVVDIISEKFTLSDGTEIQNGDLIKYLPSQEIFLSIETELGTLTAKSKVIGILPEYSIQISEIYPSPEDGEQEWIEIYNYGADSVTLQDLYFKDKGSNADGTGNTKHTIDDLILGSGEYLVIQSPNISLNNSGDVIFIFDPLGNLLDKFDYQSIERSFAAARQYDGDKYEVKTLITSIPTPNEENQFLKDVIPYSKVSEVENLTLGDFVKLNFVVISNFENHYVDIFNVRDDTGGIRVKYSGSDLLKVEVGDSIQVFGNVAEDSKGKYIKLSSASDISDTSEKLPANPALLSGEFDNYLQNLIMVEGEIVSNYSTSFDIRLDSGEEIKVTALSKSGITLPKRSKGDRVKVTGILELYKESYRLLPRFDTDVEIIPKEKVVVDPKKSKSEPKILGVGTSATLQYRSPSSEIFAVENEYVDYIETKTSISIWPFFMLYSFVLGLVWLKFFDGVNTVCQSTLWKLIMSDEK